MFHKAPKPVPDSLHPDCNNCNWFLLEYDREDLEQVFNEGFNGYLKGWHVLPKYAARTKMEKRARGG